jgi:hypothetical protein
VSLLGLRVTGVYVGSVGIALALRRTAVKLPRGSPRICQLSPLPRSLGLPATSASSSV